MQIRDRVVYGLTRTASSFLLFCRDLANITSMLLCRFFLVVDETVELETVEVEAVRGVSICESSPLA